LLIPCVPCVSQTSCKAKHCCCCCCCCTFDLVWCVHAAEALEAGAAAAEEEDMDVEDVPTKVRTSTHCSRSRHHIAQHLDIQATNCRRKCRQSCMDKLFRCCD
jgi:hypothetical protein